LKGFNYHAPIPPYQPGITPPRRDWRKRTRELEAKKVVKPATPPSNKPVGKRRKP
jgi:hypothetical protein